MIRHLAPGALTVNVDGSINKHLASAKAWVKFTVTGGVVKAYNVSTSTGVTHPGTGDWTVSFTKDFSSTTGYTSFANTETYATFSPGFSNLCFCVLEDSASGSIRIRSIEGNLGAYSETAVAYVNLVCFGEQ